MNGVRYVFCYISILLSTHSFTLLSRYMLNFHEQNPINLSQNENIQLKNVVAVECGGTSDHTYACTQKFI